MLLHAVGFEWGTDGEEGITRSNLGVTYRTSPKRTGTRSIEISGVTMVGNFSYWFRLPLSQELSEFYYQFGFYVTQVQTSAKGFCAWRKGTTILGGLRLNTSNRIELWTGNFATKVGESTTVLQPNRWYVLEVRVKIDDNFGVLTLRIDMNEEAAFVGDTKPGTETTVDNLIHGDLYNGHSYYDDLIVHDPTGTVNNSWPNGAKVALLRPNADGSVLEWVPTPSGPHYDTIDDSTPSGTDYLQATEVDKVDELELEDLPAEAMSVKGVILNAWALKGSTISPTRLAMGLNLGGANYYTPDKDLGTSQGYIRHVWNQHPGGGNFAVSQINSSKLLLRSRP